MAKNQLKLLSPWRDMLTAVSYAGYEFGGFHHSSTTEEAVTVGIEVRANATIRFNCFPALFVKLMRSKSSISREIDHSTRASSEDWVKGIDRSVRQKVDDETVEAEKSPGSKTKAEFLLKAYVWVVN
ncbi:hypothetical protein BDV11DRAFT_169922 [Aspergillus similis]